MNDANDIKEIYKNYILDVLKKTTWSANQLAIKAGVAQTTITRFLNSNNYKFIPSLNIDKLHFLRRANGLLSERRRLFS